MRKRAAWIRCVAGLLLAVTVLAVAGCDSPRRTLEEVRREVGAYASAPSGESATKIDEAFDRLDRQIGELRAKGKTAEARTLQEERDTIKARYTGAKVAAGLQGLKHAAQQVGEALRQAGETLGGAQQGDPY